MLLRLLLPILALSIPDWIGWEEAFPWDVETEHSRLSVRYLRTEFPLDGDVQEATLDICGLGLYECYINGSKVGGDVLTPNPTDYRKTLLYNTYDVSQLLASGPNALGVALGPGRFYTMQQHYKPHKIRTFGYPKLWMRLHIRYADGRDTTVVSSHPAAVGQSIRAIISAEDRPDEGLARVRFSLKPHKVFLFDHDSEERIEVADK